MSDYDYKDGVARIRLVLEADLCDGTVVRGVTQDFAPAIVDVEDVRVFHELDKAAGNEIPPFNETLVNVLLSRMQRAQLGEADAKDLIDLCRIRLNFQLRLLDAQKRDQARQKV